MNTNSQLRSNNQVRAIFGQARKCQLDEEGVRDVVESVTGRTRSIRELTHAEAEAVLKQLKGKDFVPLRTMQYRRQKQGVKQVVQQSQLNLIADLASQRHWSPETLAKFCLRQCGHRRPRTTEDANKVVEGLKAMNRRENLWAN